MCDSGTLTVDGESGRVPEMYIAAAADLASAGKNLRCVSPSSSAASILPRDPDSRGSQISFTHAEGGYAIISALIAEGVIGDFRAPDVLRFGFTPLYTSFADVWHAVDRMAAIMNERRWDKPEFHARKAVT